MLFSCGVVLESLCCGVGPVDPAEGVLDSFYSYHCPCYLPSLISVRWILVSYSVDDVYDSR